MGDLNSIQTGFSRLKVKERHFDDVAQLENTFNVLSIRVADFLMTVILIRKNQYVI